VLISQVRGARKYIQVCTLITLYAIGSRAHHETLIARSRIADRLARSHDLIIATDERYRKVEASRNITSTSQLLEEIRHGDIELHHTAYDAGLLITYIVLHTNTCVYRRAYVGACTRKFCGMCVYTPTYTCSQALRSCVS